MKYEIDKSNIILEIAFDSDNSLKKQSEEITRMLNDMNVKLKRISKINNLSYKIINNL